MNLSTKVERKIERSLFLGLFFFYLAFAGGHLYTADDWSRYYAARGFLLHLKPEVPDQPYVYGMAGENGRRVSHFPPGLSLASLPLLGIGHGLGKFFPGREELVERMSLSVFNQLLMPILLVLLYRLLRTASANRRKRIMITLIAACGSLAFPYAKHFWAEPLQTTLIIVALLQIPRIQGGPARSQACFLLSGSLASGVLVKYETIVPAAILITVALFLHRPRTPKETIAYVGPWLVAFLIAGSYNLWRFGSILDFGYGELIVPSAPFGDDEMVKASFLHGPAVWFRRAYLQLLSPGKGLFVYVPLTVLAVVGTASKRTDLGTRLGFICGYALLVFYIVLDRSSTWCWGPRYLFPTMILWWPGLMLINGRKALRSLASILAVLGILAAILGVLVNFHDAIEEIKAKEGYEGWEWVEHVHSEPRLCPLVWHARLMGPYLLATMRAGMEEPAEDLPPVKVRHQRIDIVWLSLWAGGIPWVVLLIPVALLIGTCRRIHLVLREAS